MIEEEIEYYRRRCKFCNKPFLSNHGNRLFCDPATQKIGQRNCKVTYNNWKARKERELTLDYERALRHNWLILNNLLDDGRQSTTKAELILLGFNFDFFTSYVSESEDKDIYQIFNIDLVSLDDESFFIV